MTLAQRKADEVTQAEQLRIADLLSAMVDGIQMVADCVIEDPALGIYAGEVRTLKVLAYMTLSKQLCELRSEVLKQSHGTPLGIA